MDRNYKQEAAEFGVPLPIAVVEGSDPEAWYSWLYDPEWTAEDIAKLRSRLGVVD